MRLGIVWFSEAALLLLLISSSKLVAQSTNTYHLHRENSATTGLFQLKTNAPDASNLAVQSAELKNQPAGEYIVKAFDTQSGVPNVSGTIASGSTVTFTVWMRKTASFGTLFPRVKLHLNSVAGTSVCTATGSTALTTTLAQYTLTCATSTPVSMTSSDRFYLWIGINMTAGPGNKALKAQLNVEGTLNGNYDSRIVVPMPNAAPTCSITAPANNASFAAGSNIAINATASDSDGSISKVEFFQGSTKLGEDTSSPYSFTWNNVAAGSYSLTAKATDNGGAATTSTVVNITVTAPNSPPTASIVNPANNASFPAGSNITVDATASDSDGSVTKVEFFQGATKLGEDTTSPYSFTWNNVSAGNYSLTAKATDNLGATTTSAPIAVSVGASINNGPVTYIYDELERLVGVVDGTGEGASYSYDAVGNLLSISRYSTGQVSIIEFSPNSAPVGTTVTISGTAFSSTPSQNSVTFNGATATVTSATTTQIVATVPAGATTGPIAVTTPGGSATSSTPFTVATAIGAPTISGFSPAVGASGSTIQITGTNFNPVAAYNRVTLNGIRCQVSSATGTQLSIIVPSAGGGRISVTTPSGSATSSGDFFIPQKSFLASDVEFTARMSLGESKVATINTSGKIGLVLFDASAGQRVTLSMSATIGNSQVYIYRPDGGLLQSTSVFSSTGGLIDAGILPVTGSYTIMIDPASTSTGSLTLNLYNTPDVTGNITIGGAPVTVSTTIPGQNIRISFSGMAGQDVNLAVSNVTIANSEVYISNIPSAGRTVNTQGYLLDATLPVTGTYEILVDPNDQNVGSVTLTLTQAPTAVTSNITMDGPPVTVTTTQAGQRARLTFTAAANQQISLKVSNVTCAAYVSIIQPNGNTVGSPDYSTGSDLFFEPLVLPATGTYTILFDPENANFGGMTARLYNALPDSGGAITPGGAPVTVTTTAPGQNAWLSFTGTAGQRVSVTSTNSSYANCGFVAIFDSQDIYAGSSCLNGFLPPKLLSTEEYYVWIDPQGADTGSVTITMYDVGHTEPISINGSAVNVNLPTAGQSGLLTFFGTQGQQISIHGTSNTIGGSTTLLVLKPDGSTHYTGSWSGASFDLSPTVLPVAGSYRIVVDPSGTNTGSVNVSVTSP